MRRVETTWVDEAHGCCETRGAKCREVVDGGQEDGAGGGGCYGVVDELDGVVCGVGGVGEEDGFAGCFGLGEEEGVALGG